MQRSWESPEKATEIGKKALIMVVQNTRKGIALGVFKDYVLSLTKDGLDSTR